MILLSYDVTYIDEKRIRWSSSGG